MEVASHEGVFRGARFSSPSPPPPTRAPLKTEADGQQYSHMS